MTVTGLVAGMVGTPIADPRYWHLATDGHRVTIRKDPDETFVLIVDDVLRAGESWPTLADAAHAALT